MLAGLGLVENSATNVVAAMLVSPLMGPVMSLTFGTMIADKELQSVGLKSLFIGIFISILFGFIFGLIIGSTVMPWGNEDWPTPEMKGRGNYRSLWMGVLWALPSGIGVAVALLQGFNGPLIGVAISASLLPPVVNCGLYWALGCTWLLYSPVKMPHLKGESWKNHTTAYVNVYADWIPVEFFCNGIISACLTLVNVLCIFITAVIVLKIKEVSAPWTSTPELLRFWQHDLSYVRSSNTEKEKSDTQSSIFNEVKKDHKKLFEKTLDEAILEAINDETFRKICRVSYGQYTADQITAVPENKNIVFDNYDKLMKKSTHYSNCSNIKFDLEILEKLLNQLVPTHKNDVFDLVSENETINRFNYSNTSEYIPLISKNEVIQEMDESLKYRSS